MTRAFCRTRNFSLVGSAKPSFCAFSDFPETGKKTAQHNDVAKINILYVFFAEIAIHPSFSRFARKLRMASHKTKDALP